MSLRSIIMLMPKGSRTYATWNPADNGGVTLSNGNLTATSAANTAVRSTLSKSSGKWYWEVTCVSISNYANIGIANSSAPLNSAIGTDTNGCAYTSDGFFVSGNSNIGGAIATYANGNTLGFAYDAGARTLAVYKNNVLQFTCPGAFIPSGAVFAAFSGTSSGISATANFGASAFTYTPPAGFNSGLYV